MTETAKYIIELVASVAVVGLLGIILRYFFNKALKSQDEKMVQQCKKLEKIDTSVRLIETEIAHIQEKITPIEKIREKVAGVDVLNAEFVLVIKQINLQIERLTKKLEEKNE